MKMNYRISFICLLLLGVSAKKSFTSPVPEPNATPEDQEAPNEVQQLENLHNENNKPAVPESNPEETEPQPEPKPEQATESSVDDSSPQPNSRSAIFRHRGITQAKKSQAWKNENQNRYVQYSPTDLAEYVFKTGDEEGVALAVEELVREGLMGRTDAINYLQDVKQELAYMREQYEQQRRLQELRNQAKAQMMERLTNPLRNQFLSALGNEKREPKVAAPPAVISTTGQPDLVIASTHASPSTNSASTTSPPKTETTKYEEDPKQDGEKRTHLGKSPNDVLYHDNYALEEVIYHVSKDMFTQGILRGDQTAENTLSRLVSYMENEVENKHISPPMRERVLEIVTAALVDTLREYQGLQPENQVQVAEGMKMYRRQTESGVPVSGQHKLRMPLPDNGPKSS